MVTVKEGNRQVKVAVQSPRGTRKEYKIRARQDRKVADRKSDSPSPLAGQTEKETGTMSKKEMVALIETMNNYDELAAKAKAKADAIREAIKEEMVRLDTEELTAGAYIVRFTNVISNRFDSTTFKRLYADLYKDFTKPVSSRRFTVSC